MRKVQDVRLVGLAKSYGKVNAVHALDLEIAAGEFVSLLGPSGCGKTTVLRMIAGFVEPTAGSIFIGGQDIVPLPPYRRNVGLVFQSYALWPHMTVEENVSFGLKLKGLRGADLSRKIARGLEATNLIGLEKRFPREISGGQQQRVALARALVLDPPLLLLDEPLSNLDRKLRVVMRKELKELQAQLGMTTLYVTHDQDEALSMSDRVAVMNAGRLVRVARPHDLYDDPRNDFVANFVGSTNIIKGRVVSQHEHTAKVAISESLIISVITNEELCNGEEVRLMVRPERITISNMFSSAENNFQGNVTFVDYFGPIIRYSVRLTCGQDLIVEQTNYQATITPGEDVWISIKPSCLKLLNKADAS